MARTHAGTLALIASRAPALAHRTSTGDLLPTIVTPEVVKAKLDHVRGAVASLDASVKASNVPEQFKREWGAFRDTYEAFYQKSYNDSWALFWSGKALLEQTEQYERDALAWRGAFEAQGGKPTAPPPQPAPPPGGLPEVVGRAEGIAKAVAVVAVVGGAIYLANMVKR